jgi:predicted dehydrogenase
MSIARQVPLAVGVVGGGLIAQVEHIPNLLGLPELFKLKGVCDPSPATRARLAARYGVAATAELDELIALGLDAVVVASPDPWHGDTVARALTAGLAVFCEKPLCYGPAEIDALIAARDAAGGLLQVGYMKRFDPAYRRALELVSGRAANLRMITVEVSDPDAWPFVDHLPYASADDVAEPLRAATSARRAAQIRAALGFDPTPEVARGFAGSLSSCLVHDVNAVHGLLDALGIVDIVPRSATIFDRGDGCQATVALDGGRALWATAQCQVPALAGYAERIRLHFDDAVVELSFPSPYLNHHPTRLIVARSSGLALSTEEIRVSYRASFVEELRAFAAAVIKGTPADNPAEDARRDAELLVALARLAAKP